VIVNLNAVLRQDQDTAPLSSSALNQSSLTLPSEISNTSNHSFLPSSFNSSLFDPFLRSSKPRGFSSLLLLIRPFFYHIDDLLASST
jgi:hypothetical protein